MSKYILNITILTLASTLVACIGNGLTVSERNSINVANGQSTPHIMTLDDKEATIAKSNNDLSTPKLSAVVTHELDSGAHKLDGDTHELVDNTVDKEDLYYSERFNVSIEEAQRREFINLNRDAVFDALDDEFKGRIAGSYIENAPEYKYVLRIVGAGDDVIRQVNVYDSSNVDRNTDRNTDKYEVLPVEIKYGARFTREEARLQQTAATQLVKRYFAEPQMIYYDDKLGVIVSEVKDKPSADNLNLVKRIQSQWGQDKLPLVINFVSYTIMPL